MIAKRRKVRKTMFPARTESNQRLTLGAKVGLLIRTMKVVTEVATKAQKFGNG